MNVSLMEPSTDLIRRVEIDTGKEQYILTLKSEDLSAMYPGMVRYTIAVTEGNRSIAVFRTNSYEYLPLVPLAAETVAQRPADEWEREIRNNPMGFMLNRHPEIPKRPVSSCRSCCDPGKSAGNWQLQHPCRLGSERSTRTRHAGSGHLSSRHGNTMLHRSYQCYDTGTCIFEDDMKSIIDAIRSTSLLVVCSPVYTNTVPGRLKAVNRPVSGYRAERALSGGSTGQRGLIFSVAVRKGEENFTCTTRVVSAFLRNLGIAPVGEILIDRLDEVRDIRIISGIEEKVRETVKRNLFSRKMKDEIFCRIRTVSS